MPPADHELIQRITQKDHSAFDTLFNKYKISVYRFILYLSRDQNVAEELFQETWLRAARYLPSQPGIKNFKSWIFRIATNLHRDQLRKQRIRRIFGSRRSVESDIADNFSRESADSIIPVTDDNPGRIDLQLALNKAIANLPEKQRRIFVLKEIEGFKHREISKILNLPVGTVKSLLHRAIKNLQQELDEFRN